jgi:hypothetical protein
MATKLGGMVKKSTKLQMKTGQSMIGADQDADQDDKKSELKVKR